MIVLTTGSMKMTYEAEQGALNCHRKCYNYDQVVHEDTMPKDEAFDQIMRCISVGWKQGG